MLRYAPTIFIIPPYSITVRMACSTRGRSGKMAYSKLGAIGDMHIVASDQLRGRTGVG
jgi:hypothetical protein